ncbi:hypothetical protein OG741_36360 [Streptomyces sp. NBC_01410]|uniref:hypothetical protein n=1 Tax=Streptomyces sp. NBC_01410 TaxID=2903856 RepID=UPI00324AA73A
MAGSLFPTSTTTTAAWRHKPTWYAISSQGRTTDPGLQRFLATRMRARTIELPADHLSIITHPDAIAHLILTAAQSS